MTAYVVYEAVVTDAEQYERYKTTAAASVAAAGGRYVARGGEVESLEGAEPARVEIWSSPTWPPRQRGTTASNTPKRGHCVTRV